MVPKQTGASVCVWEVYSDWEGSRTKSESQLRRAHLQLASRKGEIQWCDSGYPGHKTKSKYKYFSDWTPKIRRYQFSVSHSCSFPSLFFDGLILTTFFLKASTPSEGVQATCPRVLYPEGISNKERKYWRHQSSRVFSEWPTADHVYSPSSAILQGHGVLWLALHGHWPWPSSTHDCQFPPELHDWSWGEAAPKKVTGR